MPTKQKKKGKKKMMLRCLGDPVLGEAVSLEIVIF